MKSYRVYQLKNEEERSYIGLSEDVNKRLEQHNEGESKWTKRGIPWRLVWKSREMTLGEARKLENLLKRQKGGSGLARLLEAYRSDS